MRQVIICAIFVVVGIFFVFATERISAKEVPCEDVYGAFGKQNVMQAEDASVAFVKQYMMQAEDASGAFGKQNVMQAEDAYVAFVKQYMMQAEDASGAFVKQNAMQAEDASVAFVKQNAMQAEDASVAFVKQRRPVFSSFRPLFDSNVIGVERKNEIIRVVQESSRKGIGETLADWGVIIPKEDVTLSINLNNLPGKLEGAEVEEITWEFSKDYYFPETSFAIEKIKVAAWHSFPVTVRVKRRCETNFKTYTTWINVD